MSGSEFDFSDDLQDDQRKQKPTSQAVKRKASDQRDEGEEPGRKLQIGSKRAIKRQKHQQNKSGLDNDDFDDEKSLDLRIASMGPSLLADHWARQIKRFEPDIDTITLEDRRIPESAFVETTSWDKERTSNGLAEFVERFSGQSSKTLSKAPETKGSPHSLVIAAAGIRAVDLRRDLSPFQSKQATIAKLFAKHIKLKDAVQDVQNQRISFAVGTPQRIADLLDAGALSLDHLTRVIIDGSWINAKRRTILDLPEIQMPLSRLLSRQEFKSRYEDGKTRILVF